MFMFKMLIYFMVMAGLLTFVSLRKHLLNMILSLEFIMLSLLMFLFNYLSFYVIEMYLMMFFFIFIVCEGALGLSILVSMIRTHGNNFFQTFNILMC